jgi:hypothetical protein
MPPIHLKADWDSPCPAPSLDTTESVGHFVGREDEIERLANELVRSSQRSILVSGHRGVGKTTLVYEAFRRAEKLARDTLVIGENRLVPVLLNANQLVVDPDEQREVLVAIIRRLFRATSEGALRDGMLEQEIARLYKRAVASQYKQSESQGRALERLAEERRETSVDVRLPAVDTRTIASFALAWGGAAVLGIANPLDSQLDALAAVVLAGPVPVLMNVGLSWNKATTSKESAKREAEELYEFDASPGNLEFDLERIHRTMGKRRIVYIVDEVDKLTIDEALGLFSAFKNLFTLSSAIFIFISDADLYDHIVKLEQQTFRPPSYTFFHSRYFIGRPRAADLLQFVDEVVEEADAEADPLYVDTRSALVFASGGDFFDLVQRIRDRIDDFDQLKPKIDLRPLTADQERAKQLGAAIQVLFEGKYYSPVPSEWRTNESLQAALYDATQPMATLAPGAPVADPTTEDLPASATRDLNRLLERVGMLAATAATPTQIGGREVEVKTYNFVGTAPDGIPTTLGFLTEPELAVVAAWDAFDVIGKELWETYRAAGAPAEPDWDTAMPAAKARLQSWALDLDGMRTTYTASVKALREEEPPPTHDRSTLESWRSGLDATMTSALSSIPGVLAQMIAALSGDGTTVEQLTSPAGDGDTALVTALKAQLSFPGAYVVSRAGTTRQAVVVSVEAVERVQTIAAEAAAANEPVVVAVATTQEPSISKIGSERAFVVTYVPRQPRSDGDAANAAAVQRAVTWLASEATDPTKSAVAGRSHAPA